MTFDDLPYVKEAGGPAEYAFDASEARKINQRILAALRGNHVPRTGFVIEKDVQKIGTAHGTSILQDWVKHGFDLGNYSYSHPDFNQLSIEEVEHAALMLGSDKSRGYCLEMICADFLAGANLDSGNSEVLLQSIVRLFKLLPGRERQTLVRQVTEKAS